MTPLGIVLAEACADYLFRLFADRPRFVTMQNLVHDGGFSFIGISEASSRE